ncbi:hypothetical protein [Snuella sedimenti]|uniref:Outer membrane protein beta-barrel domain-containing protein n=1 Tax=Snuella sedimenti TaxID=2798802 RepID=A0A8J7LTN7_9FLAO|nr:hypothetical protein [Snuella sedimenti]MBJ6369240.1 hypothetical protein [Snuella sedimenti]
MKHITTKVTILLICFYGCLHAQEQNNNYIEFNDRKNTVHGVYLGIGLGYGTIKKADTYTIDFKIAYVANQQFEVGFEAVSFYSDQNTQGLSENDRDLVGIYGGLHLEPILFGKSKFNLSFPLLVGGGAIGLLRENFNNTYIDDTDWKAVFVVEPGISVLYNISRYIQLEAGIKHRFTSRVNFQPEHAVTRVNGFTTGIGLKVGVFNMGRNRYKQNKNL